MNTSNDGLDISFVLLFGLMLLLAWAALVVRHQRRWAPPLAASFPGPRLRFPAPVLVNHGFIWGVAVIDDGRLAIVNAHSDWAALPEKRDARDFCGVWDVESGVWVGQVPIVDVASVCAFERLVLIGTAFRLSCVDVRAKRVNWTLNVPAGLIRVASFGDIGALLAKDGEFSVFNTLGVVQWRASHPQCTELAVGPGGLLATIGGDGAVQLWRDGGCLARLQLVDAGKGSLLAVAWDATGSRLAVGGVDGVVHVVDTEQPRAPTVVRRHEQLAGSLVHGVHFRADGGIWAFSGNRMVGIVHFPDLASGQLASWSCDGSLEAVFDSMGSVTGTAALPSGDVLVAYRHGVVRRWPQRLNDVAAPPISRPRLWRVTSDGAYLLVNNSTYASKALEVRDMASMAVVRTLPAWHHGVFSDDGRQYLYKVAKTTELRAWNIDDGTERCIFPNATSDPHKCLGDRVLSWDSFNKRMHVFHRPSGSVVTFGVTNERNSAHWYDLLCDGTVIAVVGESLVHFGLDGSILRKVHVDMREVYASPLEPVVLLSGLPGIALWDARTQQTQWSLAENFEALRERAFAWAPDGKQFALCDRKAIHVFNADGSGRVLKWEPYTDRVMSISWQADVLVSIGASGEVAVWNTAPFRTGSPLASRVSEAWHSEDGWSR